jgi:hypothetical protein
MRKLSETVFYAAFNYRAHMSADEYKELLRLSNFLAASRKHGPLTVDALIQIEKEKIECDQRHKS